MEHRTYGAPRTTMTRAMHPFLMHHFRPSARPCSPDTPGARIHFNVRDNFGAGGCKRPYAILRHHSQVGEPAKQGRIQSINNLTTVARPIHLLRAPTCCRAAMRAYRKRAYMRNAQDEDAISDWANSRSGSVIFAIVTRSFFRVFISYF
jgi:hypothetical protein